MTFLLELAMRDLNVKPIRSFTRLLAFAACALTIIAAHSILLAPSAQAQSDAATRRADDALAAPSSSTTAATTPPAAQPLEQQEMSLWDLYVAGGIFMIPITLISFVALAFAVERFFALRREKVVPRELVSGFGDMSAHGGFDPRKAYRLCQQYPSAAANVVRAMLLKVGRPHSEVEQAVADASDREANKLYTNIRPIALSVTIEPLLGLLGTVQGMIMAFYATAYAPVGVNKAQYLAAGIYTALITTFGGLTVAIPAACVVHYFEGRIMARFREIDELLANLLPQVERYEGKLRANRQQTPDAATELTASSSTT
jgi:biopolymer transport protein ExbB